MKNLLLLLFATTGGLVLSGIVANIYRILAKKPDGPTGIAAYYAVMVLAGPSVLFENATKSFRTKACSGMAYGFAVAVASYWAFMLGLLIIDISLAL